MRLTSCNVFQDTRIVRNLFVLFLRMLMMTSSCCANEIFSPPPELDLWVFCCPSLTGLLISYMASPRQGLQIISIRCQVRNISLWITRSNSSLFPQGLQISFHRSTVQRMTDNPYRRVVLLLLSSGLSRIDEDFIYFDCTDPKIEILKLENGPMHQYTL